METAAQMVLIIPGTNQYLSPGNKVKLSRFSNDRWIVGYDWYTWGGNRPVCGWYLIDSNDPEIVKPLHLADLADIYIIEQ